MTADQPTPDVETLLGEQWMVFRKHSPAGAYLPVGQLDGDCRECGHAWPCADVLAVLEPLIREREAKALEDAAGEWEDPSPENVARLRQMALDQYRAGGPSMPAIWLRDLAATHRTQP